MGGKTAALILPNRIGGEDQGMDPGPGRRANCPPEPLREVFLT
jgi:hypothetical protein